MKAFLLICISAFTFLNTNAQSSKGPKTGGGFSSESFSGSTQSWVSVENAEGSDNLYADFSNLNTGSNIYTEYLFINKFQLNIPNGKIITGIEITFERSDPDQNTADYSVRIVKYGIVTGDEKSTGDVYTAADSDRTFGGPSDLWGEVWTEDMVNENSFGVAISAQRINGSTGTTNGRIDNVLITVYYDDASTLPVSLLNFTAKKNNKSIDLAWITDAESNMSHYEIQRSSDGRNFTSIKSVQSNNSTSRISYSGADSKPLNGVSYYRLKMIETDGSATYSKIVSVHFATGSLVTVYPTLWKKGTTLNISNPNNEKLIAYFFTSTGQHVGISITTSSLLPTNALNNQKGIVYYKITNDNGQQIGTGNILVN